MREVSQTAGETQHKGRNPEAGAEEWCGIRGKDRKTAGAPEVRDGVVCPALEDEKMERRWEDA